ncbi:MAG: type II toxin-antitoxin system RelE/ParE family toxin [Oligoflexales bacterium]|nr:type II toxin-antitoxin system RelE/ParE family toxin [Oligoflexales bacterium]
MIRNFGNKAAADLFHKGSSRNLPSKYHQRAVDLLDIMEAVDSLIELDERGFPPSLRIHRLKGDRKGEFALDINKTSGWRITFFFEEKEFVNVKVENYHR